MQKTIELGRLQLTSRVMNAAGPWASDSEKLTAIYNSNAGAVVTKTFTLQPTAGNEKPNTYFDSDFSVNSVGLTNKGADYFIAARKELGDKKPIIASIAADSTEDFVKLAKFAEQGKFDAIELTLSCPNVATKEPIAYYPEQLNTLLESIFEQIKIPVGVKLPPFVMRSHMVEVADVIAKHPINHLVVINTYPFASVYVDDRSAIKPNDGVGGLGGNYLKPIALAHVVLFKKLLPDIPIVAVGGIGDTVDVKDFEKAGATAFQIGTAIQNQGMSVLNKLL